MFLIVPENARQKAWTKNTGYDIIRNDYESITNLQKEDSANVDWNVRQITKDDGSSSGCADDAGLPAWFCFPC